MEKLFKLLILVSIMFLVGCAATARMIDYGHMKTDVAMSESIFLSPTEAPKTIYIQVRNTSSNQNITELFESTILSGIQRKDYQIVQKPSQATYILQANIRYLGEWREGMNFQNTVSGAGLGALVGLGLGAGPRGNIRGGAIGSGIGSVIGAGIGFAADMATRIRTEIIVIEFQITERLSEEEDITGQQVQKSETIREQRVLGGMGTMPDQPTRKSTDRRVASTKAGTNIYNAAVAARAAQVNLNVAEASLRLVETAGHQIVGIF